MLFGQSKKALESKRKRLINDINLTTRLIKKASKNKAAALDRYITLKRQIQNRLELVETLQLELDYVSDNLERTNDVVASLEEDIKRLEEEYAVMARQAYRHKVYQNDLLFLFSSDSFNQAFRRWKYLRQYDATRKKTADLLISTKSTLNNKLLQLDQNKIEKENLLVTAEKQLEILSIELDEKDQLLAQLRKDENRLQRELAQQQKTHDKLNNAIEAIIQKEVAANRKRERSRNALADANTKPNKGTSITKTNHSPSLPANSKLTQDFAGNKGRLPWPVRNGMVSKFFGKQKHPTLKKIEITNNGIDILTEKKADVRAVFRGEIVGKQFIPGYSNMVIIKHGNYYTVYSNLGEVMVNLGEFVRTKQQIGVANVDQKTGKSEVHFEVWKDKIRLNPISWVTRK